eukprot:746831-Hanusia_phi.AAC.1
MLPPLHAVSVAHRHVGNERFFELSSPSQQEFPAPCEPFCKHQRDAKQGKLVSKKGGEGREQADSSDGILTCAAISIAASMSSWNKDQHISMLTPSAQAPSAEETLLQAQILLVLHLCCHHISAGDCTKEEGSNKRKKIRGEEAESRRVG